MAASRLIMTQYDIFQMWIILKKQYFKENQDSL